MVSAGSNKDSKKNGNSDNFYSIRLLDTAPTSILDSEELVTFIKQNAKADIHKLNLSLSGKSLPFDLPFALTQIESRRKNARKIPSFLKIDNFFFPSDIAAQQATDEYVAKFHSTLVPPHSKWLDLTAGLGIDALTAAIAGHFVIAVEIESWKCEVLRHNSKLFFDTQEENRFEVICDDALHFLDSLSENEFDVIFIDPARRSETNKRLFSLSDCIPDVTSIIFRLLRIAPRVIIKASPMLDITEVKRLLPNISHIRVVSVNGECKEVLITCSRDKDAETVCEAVMIHPATSNISILSWGGESKVTGEDSEVTLKGNYVDMGTPLDTFKYLYEPEAALQKFPSSFILRKWKELRKCDPNSSIYFSADYIPDFPGRVTSIESFPSASELKNMKGNALTVISRNHPEKAENIRKKFSFKEGTEKFIYATRINNKPIYILTREVKK